MENKYNIKNYAIKILDYVYLHCNTELWCYVDYNSILKEPLDPSIFEKSLYYLEGKSYIIIDKSPSIAKTEQPKVKITSEGIDWIEDLHNIKYNI